MNVRQFFHRAIKAKALAAIALLGVAGMAHAGGGVSWSVGVNAPIIPGPGHLNAVVSNGPGYYYAPPPVYVHPRVVVPRPHYGYGYGVQPVVYQAPPPRFRPPGWDGRWHRHGRAEAYAHGYRRGYERGYDRGNDHDGRRGGGWHHHHHGR